MSALIPSVAGGLRFALAVFETGVGRAERLTLPEPQDADDRGGDAEQDRQKCECHVCFLDGEVVCRHQ